MSDDQSNKSARILDVDDGAAQETVPQDRPEESDGSKGSSKPADLLDQADLASDASGEELEDNLPLNGDGSTPPSSSPASQSQSKAKTPKMKEGKPVCDHKRTLMTRTKWIYVTVARSGMASSSVPCISDATSVCICQRTSSKSMRVTSVNSTSGRRPPRLHILLPV